MADVAVQIPPSNYILPGSHTLAPISYPAAVPESSPSDPESVINQWVSSFNHLVQTGEASVAKLFLKESYWRDLLCLTWNFHTLQGPSQVESLIKNQPKGWRIKSLKVDNSTDVGKPQTSAMDFDGKLQGVQSFLTVETDVGKGRGIVKLVKDSDNESSWKCFMLFTMLQELNGHEELNGVRRPLGTEPSTRTGGKNWLDKRMTEENFDENIEPMVLIIGSGQGGLTAAARLKQLDVNSLIVDQASRVGDNWRNRYHQLVLHDSVWFDHMPYLKFPPNWPVFTPKDKLADWFEFYASALELNVWTKTTVKNSGWDESARTWSVTLERELNGKKESRIVHPRHIIQATGASGSPSFPAKIDGLEGFEGDRLIHSSEFPGLDRNGKDKKAVIIGSCNSAHDIAQDYYEHGYDVTMVQRSSTYVITSHTLMEMMKGLYYETGPALEDADLLNFSTPSPLSKQFFISATKLTTGLDAPLLHALQAAGFSLDNGVDSSGLWMKYLHRGGGYYIDVGTSQLIADGHIKVKQGHEVQRVNPHGLTLTNGEELPADEIIFATGYGNMRDTTRKIFGDDVADRVDDVWGFDAEGETRGMWRRSGHPGFWFFGGNFALCRFYSRLLALQIKALEVGLAGHEDA